MKTEIHKENRKQLYFLLPVFIIGVIIRIFLLISEPVWYDEALTWFIATLSPAEIFKYQFSDTSPFLFYFLQHFFLKFLPNEVWSLRVLPFISNLTAVFFIYHTCKKLYGNKPAILSLTLWMLLPVTIYYSTQARNYSLLLLMQTIIIYLMTFLINEKEPDNKSTKKTIISENIFSLFFLLANISLIYIHNTGVFLFTTNIIILFILKKKSLKKILFFGLPFIIYWLYLITIQMKGPYDNTFMKLSWESTPIILMPFKSLAHFLTQNFSSQSYILPHYQGLLSPVFIIMILFLSNSMRKKKVWFPLLLVIIPFSFLVITSYLLTPVYMFLRTDVIVIPGLVIWLSCGLSETKHLLSRHALFILIILSILLCYINYQFINKNNHKEEIIAGKIINKIKPGDAIFISKWPGLPLNFYLRQHFKNDLAILTDHKITKTFLQKFPQGKLASICKKYVAKQQSFFIYTSHTIKNNRNEIPAYLFKEIEIINNNNTIEISFFDMGYHDQINARGLLIELKKP